MYCTGRRRYDSTMMIDSPFILFRPFEDRFNVRFFTKSDAIMDDDALRKALGSNETASLKQVHGSRTIIAREPMMRMEEADGIATDEAGLALSVRAADCQLFVVYEPVTNICGLLHAGWKGLIANAIPAFFSRLNTEWGIKPFETYVGAVPSLCQQCAEFTDPAKELPNIDPRFFHGRNADLRGIAESQLWSLGLPKNHFERMEGCTKCNSDLYWSYRGEREAIAQGYRNVLTCRLV